MRIFFITALCWGLAVSFSFAQLDAKKARELGRQASIEMDSGNVEAAFKLLKEAQALDTGNITYRYQAASAHYLNKDYKKSVRLLEPLTRHRDVSPQIFRLLGNSYDQLGKQDKAIETYEAGLKLSPNDGKLYNELGLIFSMKKKQDRALSYFEKGIEMDPKFAGNYYWASKIYCHTTDEVWGLLYGEMFLNLERNTQRSYEISRLLYDTYKHIVFVADSATNATGKAYTYLLADNSKPKLSFKTAYELNMLASIMPVRNEAGIMIINDTRHLLVKNWYEKEYNKLYPNILLDWHKQLVEKGHFEAYNYWLLHQGNQEDFDKWAATHQDQLRDFITWFAKTSLEVNSERFLKRN